ncbi:MAG: hypothetical protein HYX69_04775 [Planctomycetia bacterium]|nr:hypothetical protein [Planctomycetia bacterium]
MKFAILRKLSASNIKPSCKAATTANITLSGAQPIDHVSIAAGDRVLVKDQGNAAQNGIYVAASGAWSRATDMDAWSEIPDAFTFVEQGTAHGDTGFVCASEAGGTIDSTAIEWAELAPQGQFQPLDGELTALSSVTSAADKLPYFTGPGAAAVTPFTPAARDLLDDTSAETMRSTLGVPINVANGVAGLDGDGNLTLPILVKGDTASNLDGMTLLSREIALETDTGKLRYGDGHTGGHRVKADLAGQTGFIPLPLGLFRYVESANGDLIPIPTPFFDAAGDNLHFVGSAASIQKIQWPGTNVLAIQASVPLPPDFDGTQDATLHVLTNMSAATDNPTIALATKWDGGTQYNDTVSATQGTTIAERTATIAASDIPDTPKMFWLRLTPATHNNEFLFLYAVWLTYIRK